MDQPQWLEPAWAELGQKEIAGAADNARILALYRDAGHPEVRHDETAWCAAFVGACLKRAGIDPTGSLMARSYLAGGASIDTPRLGAIAILSRGADPAAGHVGFVVGSSGDALFLLGGNQSDAVTVARFPRAQIVGLRWPSKGAQGGAAPTPGATPMQSSPAQPDGQPSVPAGSEPSPMFDAALAHVLEMEGGWTEDLYDPGGPTNQGITLATYAAYRAIAVGPENLAALKQELRSISPSVVREIFEQRYWEPSRAEALPPGLALMHFDAAVNHGVGGAARMLQAALDIETDGEIGPLTIAAAQTSSRLGVLDRYAALRRERYRALAHFWRFGRGWLARVETTLGRARALAASTPATTLSPKKDTPTMTDQSATQTATPAPSAAPKWWGESMTIWGAVLTALTAVLPAAGPLIGLDITGELVRQLGEQIVGVAQALGGLAGTLMTIYGRARATAPLERRDMSVRL